MQEIFDFQLMVNNCFRIVAVLAISAGTIEPVVAADQDRVLVGSSRLVLGTETNLSASVRAGDLDGDGDVDLVIANGRHWPQQNYVFLNDGRARFNVMRPLGRDRSTSYATELADLDGDGDLDIVTGNAMAPCNIFINDGSAQFTLLEPLSEISSIRSITLADIDGDSNVDILTTSRGLPNSIYYNDGAGAFHELQPFGQHNDSTIDVSIADLNGDGSVDLLLANRDAQANGLLLNDGHQAFEASVLGDGANDSRSIATADFDGDGKLDWVVGNIGQTNELYLGDGLGGYREHTKIGEPGVQSYAVAVADMDNDGDVDIVFANVESQNTIYFNDGSGLNFQKQRFGDETSRSYGLCLADLDGDQFVDVAIANSGTANRVFLNRLRATERSNEDSGRAAAQATEAESPLTRNGSMRRSAAISDETNDWPAFRGLGARGVANDSPLPTQWNADPEEGPVEGVIWRRPIPGLGHSSPIVVGDKLFVATAIAIDGDAPLQVGRGGAPTAADDDGEQIWKVICLDKQSGDTIWERDCVRREPSVTRHAKATHANTTIAVAENRLYAFFGAEGLYCFDLEGELLWQKDLGRINISKYGIGWGYASSPAVHDDRIVLVCDDPENPFLVCLHVNDGEEIWRISRDGDSERNWSTPFIYEERDSGTTQVIVNGWPSVIAYDLEDGSELWRIRGGGDNPVPTPFAVNDRIFITSAHGDLSPIHVIHPSARGDLTEERQTAPNDSFVWSIDRGGAYMSTPVVLGDYLFVGNSNAVIRCYHASTGELMYEHRLDSGAGIIASLVAGDGKVYCAAENGRVYVLRADREYDVLSVNAMSDPCFATPAISDGVIFIRTTTELIAIGD